MKAASDWIKPSAMKRVTGSAWIAALLVAVALTAACGAESAPGPGSASSSQPSALPGSIVVVDALGRSVTFSQVPTRIVVAGKSTLTVIDTLYLFPEAQERVVGLVAGKQRPDTFLGLVDPTFDQKAMLEVEAGPEQISPLKPDVVILRSSMAEKLGQPLELLGIPVVYVDLETPEQYFRDLRTLGQLLDNQGRCAEIEAFYQSRLDALQAALRGVEESEKPRTLVVQYSALGGEAAVSVPAANWIQTRLTELAGGAPVWKQAAQGGGWTVVNLEQIAAWDPDKIAVVSYDADAAQVVQRLKADASWQSLRAVQQGQISGFAGDIYSWDQPDPRWILGAAWLAKSLHPDRLGDLDLTQEVVHFFGQMYGMDEAVIQAQILPRLRGDL